MDVSRRQLLGAVAGAGSAAVVGVPVLSSNAVAYEETATVGSDPAVHVDWRETYNGAVVESGDDADGPVLHVGNAQPGDSGTLAFRVTPATDGGARVWFSLSLESNAENGRNEPERVAGDETPDRGELAAALDVAAWYDTGSFGVSGLGGCDGDRDAAETALVDGSLLDADDALREGVRLGGDCLAADAAVCVGVAWSLPAATGNLIQGDSVETDLSFTVEPCDRS